MTVKNVQVPPFQMSFPLDKLMTAFAAMNPIVACVIIAHMMVPRRLNNTTNIASKSDDILGVMYEP